MCKLGQNTSWEEKETAREAQAVMESIFKLNGLLGVEVRADANWDEKKVV